MTRSIDRICALLALGLACNPTPKKIGDRCKESTECGEGLVCVVDTCLDPVALTKDRAKKLAERVQTYMGLHQGECPPASEYAEQVSGKDAWYRPLEVKCPGTTRPVDVVSPGPDGKLGTPDDLTFE